MPSVLDIGHLNLFTVLLDHVIIEINFFLKQGLIKVNVSEMANNFN